MTIRLTTVAVVLVVLALGVSVQPLPSLLAVSRLEHKAGRYTQIRAQPDSPPILVWNNVDKGGRIAQCLDANCSSLTIRNLKLMNGTTVADPRFIRMELGVAGNPVIAMSIEEKTKLLLLTCFDPLCETNNVTYLWSSGDDPTHDELLYFDILAPPGSNTLTTTFVVSGAQGCITHLQKIHYGKVIGKTIGQPSRNPFKIDQHHQPVSGLDNPILTSTRLGGAVAYWDLDDRALYIVFDPWGGNWRVNVASHATADAGGKSFINPGSWARMVSTRQGQTIAITFIDLQREGLFITTCDVATRVCLVPRLVDTVKHGDFTNYGAGAFPDMELQPNGIPVLVYYAETHKHGELRALWCNDELCSSVTKQVLSKSAKGKKSGYGRDASVVFHKGNMLVSFLDLEDKHDAKEMTARLALLH